jgi:hypothetical protein
MRNYALQKGPCSFLNLRISPWEVSFLFLLYFSSSWRPSFFSPPAAYLSLAPSKFFFFFLPFPAQLLDRRRPGASSLAGWRRKRALGIQAAQRLGRGPGVARAGGSVWLGSTWRRGSARHGWRRELAQATAGAERLGWGAGAGASAGASGLQAAGRRWRGCGSRALARASGVGAGCGWSSTRKQATRSAEERAEQSGSKQRAVQARKLWAGAGSMVGAGAWPREWSCDCGTRAV